MNCSREKIWKTHLIGQRDCKWKWRFVSMMMKSSLRLLNSTSEGRPRIGVGDWTLHCWIIRPCGFNCWPSMRCMMEKIWEWKWTLSSKSLNNEFKVIMIDWHVYLWEEGSWMLKGGGGFWHILDHKLGNFLWYTPMHIWMSFWLQPLRWKRF